MTVYLVGAGPGDPDLLTLRAARLLSIADVVIYDRLTTSAMLEFLREDALRVDVGKVPGSSAMTQDQINELLVEHGRNAELVVRLKGGDPFVFGRGGEEAQVLIDARVPFEVVAGVSSAIAAPSAAGIPVTMRHHAQSFTVVTGHEDPLAASEVNWEALAASRTTLVILMGVGRIRQIAHRLMSGGLGADTAVAAIHWATTDEQHIFRTTLGEISNETLRAPSTIVVGSVAGLDLRYPFERDPE